MRLLDNNILHLHTDLGSDLIFLLSEIWLITQLELVLCLHLAPFLDQRSELLGADRLCCWELLAEAQEMLCEIILCLTNNSTGLRQINQIIMSWLSHMREVVEMLQQRPSLPWNWRQSFSLVQLDEVQLPV